MGYEPHRVGKTPQRHPGVSRRRSDRESDKGKKEIKKMNNIKHELLPKAAKADAPAAQGIPFSSCATCDGCKSQAEPRRGPACGHKGQWIESREVWVPITFAFVCGMAAGWVASNARWVAAGRRDQKSHTRNPYHTSVQTDGGV